MLILIDNRGKKYLIKENQDFQTDQGIIPKEELVDIKAGDCLKTHLDYEIKVVQADVNAGVDNEVVVNNVVKQAVDNFGRIDVLCNFAGGYEPRMLNVQPGIEFPDIPIDVFDWGLDVNLKGPFYFAHAVLGVMRDQKTGLIINLGSITGMEGSSVGMAYPTSKAGLMFGLTKSQAQYGAKYGIRSVCVSPGPVLTRPGMATMKTLLGRAAEPQEIIDLILFIASSKGQFINGENIMIDGGRNCMWRG